MIARIGAEGNGRKGAKTTDFDDANVSWVGGGNLQLDKTAVEYNRGDL